MRKRTSTEQSYEPLVTPESWKGDELRFSVRLTQILDGLFARLRAMRTELAGKLGRTEQAADSAKLGGKAPEYYLTPVNLLDNSNFRNPLNTNGYVSGTELAAYTYHIDRWRTYSTGGALTLDANGISTGSVWIQQLLKKEQLTGKTLTLAVKCSDGSLAVKSGTLPSGSEWTNFINATQNGIGIMATNSAADQFFVRFTAGSKSVIWAALYEGSYSAETLPPYVPSHPRVESLTIGNPVHPVNLLDNSDFSNPVNQRGQTTFTGVGTYTIDRWYVGGSNQRIDIASGSIKAITTKGSAYATIAQTVANITRYAGKTLTFAAYVRSNVVPRLNILNGDNSFANTRGTSGDYQLITCSFVVPDGIVNRALSVRIQGMSTQVDDYVEAKWAALYEGAYTAETLPPYVPKEYAVELAECKRYFQVAKATYGLIPYHSTTASRSYNVIFEQEMRVKPTILTVAESCVEYNPGVWSNTGATFTIATSTTLNAIVTATGTITADTAAKRPFAFIAYTASADL